MNVLRRGDSPEEVDILICQLVVAAVIGIMAGVGVWLMEGGAGAAFGTYALTVFSGLAGSVYASLLGPSAQDA
ncbi:hypothetical protein FHG66_21205 [Rubellimicrobium rubrum]|uniref:Uncharacterized protein n=1 Tax=Rubellimicrobium rubrum TaxID=2585369 RepID=A0A5C4MM10_9RHOB|nr:hypothetical protein FHG66_21205 [Rubellimicrobium rubrum]